MPALWQGRLPNGQVQLILLRLGDVHVEVRLPPPSLVWKLKKKTGVLFVAEDENVDRTRGRSITTTTTTTATIVLPTTSTSSTTTYYLLPTIGTHMTIRYACRRQGLDQIHECQSALTRCT